MQNKLYLTNKSNAKQWDGRDAVWGFGKRTVLGMVTEGSDRSSDVTFLRKSQGLVKRHSYFNAGYVHFTVNWLFWNLYVVTYPLDLLSRKKLGHFSFDNMGPLNWIQKHLLMLKVSKS